MLINNYLIFLFLLKLFYYLLFFDNNINASLIKYEKDIGDYTLVFYFRDDMINESKIMLTNYDKEKKRIIFQAVHKNSNTTNVVCRKINQRRIVVDQKGCSDPTNPKLSLESSNCIKTKEEADVRKKLLELAWHLSKNGPYCPNAIKNILDEYLLDGDHETLGRDIRICAGPLRISRQNIDPYIIRERSPLLESKTPQGVLIEDPYTTKDFLEGDLFFLDCLTGPFAMSPCVIPINIVLPGIEVTSTCIDSKTFFSYTSNYTSTLKDPYPYMITKIIKDFSSTDNSYHRLFLVRQNIVSSTFKLALGNTLSSDGGFNIEYISIESINPQHGNKIFLKWIDSIEFDKIYLMRKYNKIIDEDNMNKTKNDDIIGGSICNLILKIPSSFNERTLIPPNPITAQNYSNNIYPPYDYRLSICNYCAGRYDSNGKLVCPGVAAGDLGGGYVKYSYIDPKTNLHLPLFVPKNKNYHFRFDCIHMYPSSDTFLDIAGSKIYRMNINQQRCFYPYLLPNLVESGNLPDEKYIQCYKLGGYTWEKAQTYCGINMSTVYCKKEFGYFDQRCFKKFDPRKDSSYSVVLNDYNEACKRFDPYFLALIEVDKYTEAWIYKYFLQFSKHLYPRAIYRIPGTKDYCYCFDSASLKKFRCPCDVIDTKLFNIPKITTPLSGYLDDDDDNGNSDGSILVFPICYHESHIIELAPLGKDISMDIKTAHLFQEGQEGPKPNGHIAPCSCFIGSGGPSCTEKTCPLTHVIEEEMKKATNSSSDDIVNGKLVNFFSKCYSGGRGMCYQGQSRTCQCNFPYGPSASIIPLDETTNPYNETTQAEGESTLYDYRDIPCGCPAGIETQGTFDVNGKIYNGPALHLPCSGIYQGRCILDVNSTTNHGYCICVERPNLVFGGNEKSYDGQGCSCSRAIQPWQSDSKNGPIKSDFCNGRGICCPFGQSEDDPITGDLYNKKCYDGNKNIQGCMCGNGWGGPSCTCRKSKNFAEDITPTYYNGKVIENTDSGIDYEYYILEYDLLNEYQIHHISLENFIHKEKWEEMIHGDNTTLIRIFYQPLRILLSNQLNKKEQTIECYININITYENATSQGILYEPQYKNITCSIGSILTYRYVIIEILKNIMLKPPETSNIIATKYKYKYCGMDYSINPYSGRIFDIYQYRSNTKHLENQYMEVSTYGCTNTDCMCNSDYGGKECRVKTSSIRKIKVKRDKSSSYYNLIRKIKKKSDDDDEILQEEEGGNSIDEIIQTKIYCGSLSNVPILGNSLQGRGYINKNNEDDEEECHCNSLNTLDIIITNDGNNDVEKFSGKSCQCADVYNKEKNEILKCGGHGECIESSFPFGKCEGDIYKHSKDALYTPNIVSLSTVTTNRVTMIIKEDSYFFMDDIYTTNSPTNNPTNNPTKTPTNKPTTKSPTYSGTISPTVEHNKLILRFSDDLLNYNLNDKNICLNEFPDDKISCKYKFPIFSGMFNTTYKTLPFYNRNRISKPFRISSNTNISYFDGYNIIDSPYILESLENKTMPLGNVPKKSQLISNEFPIFFSNSQCENNDIENLVGNLVGYSNHCGPIIGDVASFLIEKCYTNSYVNCNEKPNGVYSLVSLCGCLQGKEDEYLEKAQIRILLTPESKKGNELGNELETNKRCKNIMLNSGFECLNTFSILSYSDSNIINIHEKYKFNPDKTIIYAGVTNSIISRSWKKSFLMGYDNKLDNSLLSLSSSINLNIDNKYIWTGGLTTTTTTTSSSNCDDWSSSSSLNLNGICGDIKLKTSDWFISNIINPPILSKCSSPKQYACGCLQERKPLLGLIRLFKGPITKGNIGTIETSDNICETIIKNTNTICSEYFSILSYNNRKIQEISEIYNFDPLSRVLSKNTNDVIGISWKNVVNNLFSNRFTLEKSLNTSNIITESTKFWTGMNDNNNNNNCQDWTSNSLLDNGYVGDIHSISSTWLKNGSELCNVELPSLCGCSQEFSIKKGIIRLFLSSSSYQAKELTSEKNSDLICKNSILTTECDSIFSIISYRNRYIKHLDKHFYFSGSDTKVYEGDSLNEISSSWNDFLYSSHLKNKFSTLFLGGFSGLNTYTGGYGSFKNSADDWPGISIKVRGFLSSISNENFVISHSTAASGSSSLKIMCGCLIYE